MKPCPKCNEKFSKLVNSRCPNCNTKLKLIETKRGSMTIYNYVEDAIVTEVIEEEEQDLKLEQIYFGNLPKTLRCLNLTCGKGKPALLLKTNDVSSGSVQIKCKKCKTLNTFKTNNVVPYVQVSPRKY